MLTAFVLQFSHIFMTALCLKCSHLKELVSSFNDCADYMIERLKQFSDGQTIVPFRDEMGRVAVEVISKVTSLFLCTHAFQIHTIQNTCTILWVSSCTLV